jgi:glycosyltransferase involved in cell wall biosynthesis
MTNSQSKRAAVRRIWGSLDPFLESGAVLGRKVANTGFLAALLAADPFDEYHFFLGDQEHRASQAELLRELFPASAEKCRVLDRRELPARLAREPYHCFHQSDCITYQPALARVRNAHSPAAFPITGVTHSLSYAGYAEAFLRHLWPGASPRDCVVCTSRAGRAAVEAYFRQLREGYGLGDEFGQPTLRRVPLAVDAAAITPATPEQRAALRADLDLDPERTVHLVFGRLSHFSKMDLLPLLRAFQRCFQDADPKNGPRPDNTTLVLAGWLDENDAFPATLERLAGNIGLDLRIFPRPGERRKLALFRAADVFLSVADNPQETFGLTVLEAAAAGLPAVVSDYDGYRDLVLPEETGLTVPTLGPDRSERLDLMAPLLFDNQYHLLLAQRTAVDIPALAGAIARLHADPALRTRLGDAARSRVERCYTWQAVMESYLELWDELWTLPAPPGFGQEGGAAHAPHPSQVGFARIFAGYASRNLSDGTRLGLGRTGEATYRRKDAPLIYPGLAGLVEEEGIRRLLFMARKPATAAELSEGLLAAGLCAGPEEARALLLWAVKHDLLEAD